ncbi:MAG: hypothetical protein ABH840_01475 [Nanoarchaeota archaeon]
MAYEKFIKKDGKVYGPYIYHSKRVDGRVISEYHGQKKIEFQKFIWILPVVALIIFGAYLIGQQEKKVTGYSILGIDANYQEGKPLEGNVILLLKQGELVPLESKVVFENVGQSYEYVMSEIISEKAVEGNFFVSGKNLSGSGSGFGLEGMKTIYPPVSFMMLIYSKINETENIESEREVPGSVTKESNFNYQLQAGERAELKPRSVMTRGNQLSDDTILIIAEGNIISVTTTYNEEEEGFGADYIGEKTADLIININQFGLVLQPGELRVSVVYNFEELVSLQTIIGEGDVSGEVEIIPEQTNDEKIGEQTQETTILNENNEFETITEIQVQELALTLEEKNVLEGEFGNISLIAKKAISKNGFILIRYELGDYWIEYSYDSELSKETLGVFMNVDRIKWLKDVAKKLTQEEIPEEQMSELLTNSS